MVKLERMHGSVPMFHRSFSSFGLVSFSSSVFSITISARPRASSRALSLPFSFFLFSVFFFFFFLVFFCFVFPFLFVCLWF